MKFRKGDHSGATRQEPYITVSDALHTEITRKPLQDWIQLQKCSGAMMFPRKMRNVGFHRSEEPAFKPAVILVPTPESDTF